MLDAGILPLALSSPLLSALFKTHSTLLWISQKPPQSTGVAQNVSADASP